MALAAATQGGTVLFLPEYLLSSDQKQQLHGDEYRQLFLRSYPFSRKQSPRERVGRTRRLVRVRLLAARRLPGLLWTKLRCLLSRHHRHRRRYFRRVIVSQPCRRSSSSNSNSSISSGGDW